MNRRTGSRIGRAHLFKEKALLIAVASSALLLAWSLVSSKDIPAGLDIMAKLGRQLCGDVACQGAAEKATLKLEGLV